MNYKLQTCLLALLLITTSAFAEIVYLADGDGVSGDTFYVVPEGHVGVVSGVSLTGTTAEIRIGSAHLRTAPATVFTVPAGTGVRAYAGNSAGDAAFCAVETRAIETGSSYLPQNTVVIPTDAAGDVQIILESSTDLVNWTPASPGTYGSSASQRFFRVRAEVIAD